jgi:hypothetical protein
MTVPIISLERLTKTFNDHYYLAMASHYHDPEVTLEKVGNLRSYAADKLSKMLVFGYAIPSELISRYQEILEKIEDLKAEIREL